MKLQQERLLVQQLETEAAHMHLAGQAGPIGCSVRPFRDHRYRSALAQDRLRQPLHPEHLSRLQDNLCMGVPDAMQLGYTSAASIYIFSSLVTEAAGACICSPVNSPASLLLDTASSHKQPEFWAGSDNHHHADPQALRDNAANSDRENGQSPTPQTAHQHTPMLERGPGNFMRLPSWSGSAADKKVCRRQSDSPYSDRDAFTVNESPLRRSSIDARNARYGCCISDSHRMCTS